MSSEIVLDLGEYGEVIVVPAAVALPGGQDDGLAQAGLGDTVKAVGEKVKVDAQAALRLPLTGLAKLFLATLPADAADAHYQLDEFSVEFALGIEAEAGVSAGAVAKVMPNGSFTCTYTWKRKPPQQKKALN